MGVNDYDVVFDQLDKSRHGFVTAPQVQAFHKSIYFASIPMAQIDLAINRICGQSSSGKVSRELFVVVLSEIERHRTIQEEAYWDFQALDCKGNGRIGLKDALLLFQEYHGENFSLETWNKFLSSREYPYCDVYYDEIKIWLSDIPEGPPASQKELTAEEARLDELSDNWKWNEYESWKQFQDETEGEDYKENLTFEANRKLKKWNKQGIEAMLYDDGLDPGVDIENQRIKPKNHIVSDLLEAVDQKYNILHDRLLLNMAEYSSNMDSEISDIFQDLRRKTKHLLKEKNLKGNARDLLGALAKLPYSLLALFGHHKSHDKFHLTEQEIYKMRREGKSEEEIEKYCEEEFAKQNEETKLCGDILEQLEDRREKEKAGLISSLHGADKNVSSNILSTQLASLSHQHGLLGYESSINQSVLSVGLGERGHNAELHGLDEVRSKKLVQLRLDEKKGRKQVKVTDGKVTLDRLDQLGLVDLKLKVISEIDRKHFFEREAMIYFLQGPDSKPMVAELRKLSESEQTGEINHLRNQHENWISNNVTSGVPDQQTRDVHYSVLLKAVALCYLNHERQLEKTQPNISDTEISAAIFSKLNLYQEAEIKEKIQDIQALSSDELIKVIKREHKLCINECFDGVANISMGTVVLTDEEREFVNALDEKYSALRDKIFIFMLQQKHGLDWINLAEEIREKEMNKLRKEEKKLRGGGKVEEYITFLGPKVMSLPSLGYSLGQHKWRDVNDPINTDQDILSFLIGRYDEEQQALVDWLQTEEVKDMAGRKKRKEIVCTRLQTRTLRQELDLPTSFYMIGMMERLKDKEDVTRLTSLSEVSVKSWRDRRDYGIHYKKIYQDIQNMTRGDISSWQLVYLTEVKYRHSDEREVLLKIVKEVSSEYLQEAAAMMGEGDRQKRLSELQTKYQKLDLSSKDDYEEYGIILEEAGAIQVICRKAELQKERRRGVTPEMTAVSLLQNLYHQQFKEIHSIVAHLDRMTEEELMKLQKKEYEMRKNDISPNVIKVLTVVKGAAHDHDILQAIDRKYDVIKERLLLEAIKQSTDDAIWSKLSAKDKQSKLDKLRESTEISWRQEGLSTEECNIKGLEVVQFLYNRLESEKDHILSVSQGSSGVFMSDGDKFALISRLKRETTLCQYKSSLVLSGLTAGVLERQTAEPKNLAENDLSRYKVLADNVLEWCRSGQNDVKIENLQPSTDILLLQSEVLKLLHNQNEQERLDWYRLLTNTTGKQIELQKSASVQTQQQRNDKLITLKNSLSAFNTVDCDEYRDLLLEATVYKTENLLSTSQYHNASPEDLQSALMAVLLQYQNIQAEEILQNFPKQTIEELTWLSNQLTVDQHHKRCSNVVKIVFTIDSERESTQDDLLTALEGKYDALRDKLLVEALMSQYGEMDWSKITDEERQKKVFELKLKERRLRKEGNIDEINKLLGDKVKNEEALGKLMGENKAEQERKLKARLEKRKQRLKEGKTEEEIKILEEEDKQKEEEMKGDINIFQELENRLNREKSEIMHHLSKSTNKEDREKEKQSQLVKLRQAERKARNEDGFQSAALALGLAHSDSDKGQADEESEKERQWRLAKERLLAARRKRGTGKKRQESIIEENIENITNKTRLREILLMLNDNNHGENRDFLIKLLEDVDADKIATLQPRPNDYLETKISESCELRKTWKKGNDQKVEDEITIFQEISACTIEVKGREKGEGYDLDEVKVELLADLQHLQDIETRKLRLQITMKEIPWLKEKITGLKQGGSHDNVATILFLGQGQQASDGNKEETAVIAALEQKYDVMRDKIIVQALMKEMGQADWSRLTQLQKQKKVIQVKLQSRKLKREGKMVAEISDLIQDHLKYTQAIDTHLVQSKIDQQRRFEERLARRRSKQQERVNTMGITRENTTVEEFKRFEEKNELKKNILENLEKQLEADKERLLSSLRNKTNKVDRAKARWKLLAKLQREEKLLAAEDNIESAVLVFNMTEGQLRKEKSFIQERDRQRELAKGRLVNRSSPRICLEENQQDILKFLQQNRNAPVKQQSVRERVMENLYEHQQYEREVFMKLLKLAQNNNELRMKADNMTEEELKNNLTKLQKEQIKIQTDSQQVALTANLDLLNQSEQETYFVGVAKRRATQFEHYIEAVTYRIEVELRMLKEHRADSSVEDIYKELSVSLLADLQERQETESSALQNLIVEKDEVMLENICGVQKVGQREGWYKNLSVIIFTLTLSSDDLDLLPDITTETKKLEEEFERKRKEIKEQDSSISSQPKSSEEKNEDPQPHIDKLIEQFQNKKQLIMEKYESRCLEIREKLAAKRHAKEKKEIKEVQAKQLVNMAETRAKAFKDGGKPIRRKTSLLQERLSAQREVKHQAEMKEMEKQKASSRSKSIDSKKSLLAASDREVTSDQKQAKFSQIVREQQNLASKMSEQQKQQEEMLQRRLESHRGRDKKEQAAALTNLGERQKNVLQQSQNDEKGSKLTTIDEKRRAKSADRV